MSDATPTKNGNGRHGVIDRMSERLVKALPPAFLLLVILNIVFMGVAAWVFQHNTEIRNQMIQRIIESCLTKQQ